MESLEIEGFRGINQRLTFKLDRPIVFFFGKNGFGKSSVLGAIEWCLFGNLAYIVNPESRMQDEIVNIFNLEGKARVKLVMVFGNKRYEFTRVKNIGKRNTKFTITSPDGEFQDKQAENKCFTLLNITFDDFYRAVYLHQESVRGLLIDKPAIRDETMDRLFGLERLRNILKAIPIRDVRDAVKKLQTKRDRIGERIKGASEKVENDYRKNLENARELGLKEENISFEFGSKKVKSIIDRLGEIAGQYDINLLKFSVPTSVEDLNKGSIRAKKFMNECRKTIISDSGVGDTTAKKIRLIELMEKYSKNEEGIKDAKKRLSEIETKYGDKIKIEKFIGGIKAKIDKLEEKRKNINVRQRVINDAIDYFEKITENSCPVCGSAIDGKKILEKLKSQIEKLKTKTIDEIDKENEKLEKQKKELEDASSDFLTIKGELDTLKIKKENQIQSISELIGKTLEKAENLTEIVSREIKKLDADIKKFEDAHKSREEEFQRIEGDIDIVKAIHKVLTKKQEYEGIKTLMASDVEGMKTLRDEIKKLNLFEDMLTQLMKAMTSAQINLADEEIKKTSPNISKYYGILCNHPYFRGIRIDVQSKKAGGKVKNSYFIKAFNPTERKDTAVSARFSTGQMNCVALSIYMSLSTVLSHKLGFLILDDSSQSLDTEHKYSLVEILNKVVSDNQLLISTQDTEFQKILKSQLSSKEKKCIYTFENWDKKGPSIKFAE